MSSTGSCDEAIKSENAQDVSVGCDRDLRTTKRMEAKFGGELMECNPTWETLPNYQFFSPIQNKVIYAALSSGVATKEDIISEYQEGLCASNYFIEKYLNNVDKEINRKIIRTVTYIQQKVKEKIKKQHDAKSNDNELNFEEEELAVPKKMNALKRDSVVAEVDSGLNTNPDLTVSKEFSINWTMECEGFKVRERVMLRKKWQDKNQNLPSELKRLEQKHFEVEKKWRSKTKTLESKVLELEDRSKELNMSNEKLYKSKEQLTFEIERISKIIKKSRNDRDNLQAEVTKLTTSKKEAVEDYRCRMEAFQSQLKRLKLSNEETISKLRAEERILTAKHEAAHEKSKAQTKEVERLETVVALKDKQLALVSDRIKSFDLKEIELHSKHRNQTSSLHQTISHMKQKFNSLKQELELIKQRKTSEESMLRKELARVNAQLVKKSDCFSVIESQLHELKIDLKGRLRISSNDCSVQETWGLKKLHCQLSTMEGNLQRLRLSKNTECRGKKELNSNADIKKIESQASSKLIVDSTCQCEQLILKMEDMVPKQQLTKVIDEKLELEKQLKKCGKFDVGLPTSEKEKELLKEELQILRNRLLAKENQITTLLHNAEESKYLKKHNSDLKDQIKNMNERLLEANVLANSRSGEETVNNIQLRLLGEKSDIEKQYEKAIKDADELKRALEHKRKAFEKAGKKANRVNSALSEEVNQLKMKVTEFSKKFETLRVSDVESKSKIEKNEKVLLAKEEALCKAVNDLGIAREDALTKEALYESNIATLSVKLNNSDVELKTMKENNRKLKDEIATLSEKIELKNKEMMETVPKSCLEKSSTEQIRLQGEVESLQEQNLILEKRILKLKSKNLIKRLQLSLRQAKSEKNKLLLAKVAVESKLQNQKSQHSLEISNIEARFQEKLKNCKESECLSIKLVEKIEQDHKKEIARLTQLHEVKEQEHLEKQAAAETRNHETVKSLSELENSKELLSLKHKSELSSLEARIRGLEKNLDKLQLDRKENDEMNDAKFIMMDQRVKQQTKMVKQLKNEKNELAGRLQAALLKAKEKEEEARLKTLKISEQHELWLSCQDKLTEYKQTIDDLKRELELNGADYSKKTKKLEFLQRTEIEHLNKKLEERALSISNNEQRIETLENTNKEVTKVNSNLKKMETHRKRIIYECENKIQDMDLQIANLTKSLRDRCKTIGRLEHSKDVAEGSVNRLESDVKRLEIEKEVLKEKVAKISEAHRKSQVDIEKLRQASLRTDLSLMCTSNTSSQNISRLNYPSELSLKLSCKPQDDDMLHDCSRLITSQVKSSPGCEEKNIGSTERNVDDIGIFNISTNIKELLISDGEVEGEKPSVSPQEDQPSLVTDHITVRARYNKRRRRKKKKMGIEIPSSTEDVEETQGFNVRIPRIQDYDSNNNLATQVYNWEVASKNRMQAEETSRNLETHSASKDSIKCLKSVKRKRSRSTLSPDKVVKFKRYRASTSSVRATNRPDLMSGDDDEAADTQTFNIGTSDTMLLNSASWRLCNTKNIDSSKTELLELTWEDKEVGTSISKKAISLQSEKTSKKNIEEPDEMNETFADWKKGKFDTTKWSQKKKPTKRAAPTLKSRPALVVISPNSCKSTFQASQRRSPSALSVMNDDILATPEDSRLKTITKKLIPAKLYRLNPENNSSSDDTGRQFDTEQELSKDGATPRKGGSSQLIVSAENNVATDTFLSISQQQTSLGEVSESNQRQTDEGSECKLVHHQVSQPQRSVKTYRRKCTKVPFAPALLQAKAKSKTQSKVLSLREESHRDDRKDIQKKQKSFLDSVEKSIRYELRRKLKSELIEMLNARGECPSNKMLKKDLLNLIVKELVAERYINFLGDQCHSIKDTKKERSARRNGRIKSKRKAALSNGS